MEVSLNKESDSLYVIHLNTDQPSHSVWKLPYPVYQFDYGDVTGDGMPEIIVGVIKPTRFDPKPDKRLFIYRIADEAYPPTLVRFEGSTTFGRFQSDS